MSISTREAALSALHSVLEAHLLAPVERDEVIPDRIPADGLVVIRDGEAGQPEESFSPHRYHYQHRAILEVMVQGSGSATRGAAFDALVLAIGLALAADRTLGGVVEWAEPEAPSTVDLPVMGAAAIKAAEIAVVLHYSTADPLG